MAGGRWLLACHAPLSSLIGLIFIAINHAMACVACFISSPASELLTIPLPQLRHYVMDGAGKVVYGKEAVQAFADHLAQVYLHSIITSVWRLGKAPLDGKTF